MTERPIVYQVGGAGDIAGGLSRVVESMCAYSFDAVDTIALPTRRRGSLAGTVAATVSTVLTLARRVPQRRTTVLAVHLSQGGSFVREGAVSLLAHSAGFTVVTHIHGSSFAAFAHRRPGLVRTVLTRADSVLVLSDETADSVAAVAADAHVVALPNAVAVPDRTAKREVVVFAGTVSHRKGVDVLLEAWRRLPGGVATLVIAGPVEMDLTPWNDLRDIDIRGPLEHDTLLGLIASARMVVLPSRAEAMPLVLLEAMAAGCAVVSTAVGAIPTLLSGGSGVVVPPGDTDALTDTLAELIADPQRTDALGDAARAKVIANFSDTSVFPRVQDAWLGALSRRSSGTSRS